MTNPRDTKDELTRIRARALASAGRLAWFQADFMVARAQFVESLELFRQVSDLPGTLDSISGLILVLTRQGEIAEALSLIHRAESLLQPVRERHTFLPILAGLARATAFMAADDALPLAREWSGESAQLARLTGDRRSLAWSLDALAICDYYAGRLDAARAELEEGISLFEEVGDLWGVSFEKWLLASVARREGRWDESRTLNAQALTVQPQQNSRQGLLYMLDNCAFLAVEENQPLRAVRLLSTSQALGDRLSNVLQPLYDIERAGYLERARAMVNESQWAMLWKEGYVLSTDQAVALALDTTTP